MAVTPARKTALVAALTLTATQIAAAAKNYGVSVPALRAVISVESGGSGFLADGRLKILFEGHVLWKRLKLRGIDPWKLARAKPHLCFPSWTRAFYRGGEKEYDRIQEVLDWASKNDPTKFESYKKAAYESCSWGLFQMMGYHYAAVGEANVYTFKHLLETGEKAHLDLILKWMQGNGILKLLANRQWEQFALRYNGAGQVPVYAVRLRKAFAQAN